MEINYENLKNKIEHYKSEALIKTLPDPRQKVGALLYKREDGFEVRNIPKSTGKYDAALLEPYLVSEAFGMSPEEFNKFLWEKGDEKMIVLWNSFKDLQNISMLHSEKYKAIQPTLAEFALKKISKNEQMEDPIILKEYSIEIFEELLKLRNLINDDALYYKIEKEFIKNGKERK